MSDKNCGVCDKETWRVSLFKNGWICDDCVKNMIDTFRDIYDTQLSRVSGHSGLLIDLEDVFRMTNIVPSSISSDYNSLKNPTNHAE